MEQSYEIMEVHFENTKQRLIELIADFLDDEFTIMEQAIDGFHDPVERDKSELHIRMAEAAFKEYKLTITPKPPQQYERHR